MMIACAVPDLASTITTYDLEESVLGRTRLAFLEFSRNSVDESKLDKVGEWYQEAHHQGLELHRKSDSQCHNLTFHLNISKTIYRYFGLVPCSSAGPSRRTIFRHPTPRRPASPVKQPASREQPPSPPPQPPTAAHPVQTRKTTTTSRPRTTPTGVLQDLDEREGRVR